MQEALARLVLRLGSLQVGITNQDTNKACFVSVPTLDLHDFIEWKIVAVEGQLQYDDKVLDVIRDRLEQVWPDLASRPPWKLLVVERKGQPGPDVVLDIIFACHHAISDGKSTAVFHAELLRELNHHSGPPSDLKGHTLVFEKTPVLAPPQEVLVKFVTSWTYMFNAIWDEFGPAWLKATPPAGPWKGKPITLEPHKLNIRLATISPELVSSLVSSCRSHAATLTTILHVLVLTSLSRRLPADVAPAFASETAISLVPFAKLPPGVEMDISKALTVLNTGMRHDWTVDTVDELRRHLPGSNEVANMNAEETTIWPLAAALKINIKTKVDTLPNDDICGSLSWVTDWRQRWLGRVGKPRDTTWAVSNIGSMQGDDRAPDDGWMIQRAFFSQPVMVVGSAFALNVSGVKGGSVSICINWQQDVVGTQLIEGVVKDLRAWFSSFEKTGKFGIFVNEQ